VPGERVGVHRREPEQHPGIIGHGQPAGDPFHDVEPGDPPAPVDDLIQPSLADAGGGREPGLAYPGVFLHQAQQGPGGTLAERMPDLRVAPENRTGHLTWKNSVELRGFEPLTPSMRTRCATGLRYSPENLS
jgi:hypothetical protein